MAGTLKVKVVGDTKDLSSKLKGASGGIGKFAANIAKVAAAGGVAMAAFGVKSIMAASDLNETISQTGVVFGKSGKIITAQADLMAKKYGVVKNEFIGGANNLGLLAKGAGYTEKAAAKLGAGFAKVAVDASSFYNVPVAQALEDIRSGLSGESEPLKKYGILMDEAAVKTQAMKMGLGDATGALSVQEKTMARTALITKGFSASQGDMARTAGSVANRVKKVQGQFTNFSTELGAKLLPVATKVLKWLGKRLPAAFAVVQSFVTGRLIPAFDKIVPAVTRVVGVVRSIIGWLIRFRTPVTVLAGLIAGVLIPMYVAAGVAAIVSATKQKIAWATKQAAAIKGAAVHTIAAVKIVAGWVSMSGAAVVSGAQTARVWLMYKAEAVKAAAAFVATKVKIVAGWALMGVQALLGAAKVALAWLIALGPIGLVIAAVALVVGLIVKNWDKIKKVTVKVWTAVSKFVRDKARDVKDWVVDNVTRLRDKAVTLFNSVKDRVTASVGALRDRVVSFFTGLRDRVVSTTTGLRDRVVGFFTTLRDRVVEHVTGLRDRVVGFFQTIRERVAGAVTALQLRVVTGFLRLKDRAIAIAQRLVTWVSGLPGRIVRGLGNLGSTLFGVGEDLLGGLIEGIKGMVGRAVKAVTDAIGRVVDGAKRMLGISSPSKVFAEMGMQSMAGWQKGADRFKLRAPQIPSIVQDNLQARGTTTTTTTAPVSIGAATHARAPSCSCANRPIVVTLDGRTVYESVKKHAGKDKKRNTATGLV